MATEYKYIPIVYGNGKKNSNAGLIEHNAFESTYDSQYFTSVNSDTADVFYSGRDSVSATAKDSFFTRKGIVSTILLIVAVFCMLAFVLVGNARISSVTIENSRIADEISSLENEISDLELEISLATDIDYIQERASELGMSAASSNQIVYVQPK